MIILLMLILIDNDVSMQTSTLLGVLKSSTRLQAPTMSWNINATINKSIKHREHFYSWLVHLLFINLTSSSLSWKNKYATRRWQFKWVFCILLIQKSIILLTETRIISASEHSLWANFFLIGFFENITHHQNRNEMQENFANK
jgi:uncharacterized membrane protein